MRFLIAAALVAMAGVQASAATVNFTYQSGPAKLAKSCIVRDVEDSCTNPIVVARPVPGLRQVSFEIPFTFDTNDVQFENGIGTIDLSSGSDSLGATGPMRLKNDRTGALVTEYFEPYPRDIELKVDARFNVLDIRYESEFGDEDGSYRRWFVDIYKNNPIVSFWEYLPPSDPFSNNIRLETFTADGNFGAPVPLPASAPLLLGALAFGAMLRRRTNNVRHPRDC